MNPQDFRRSEAGSAERMVPAIVLIAIGAIFLLSNLQIIHGDIFRFWPVVLIVLGVLKAVDANTSSGRTVGGILVALGAAFLAQSLGYLNVEIWELWPLILIGVGLAMLFQRDWSWDFKVKSYAAGTGAKEAAVFSGGKRTIVAQDFERAQFDAVFGGFEVDMRRAQMAGNQAVLILNAVFGGIEVKIPESWNVVVKGAGVFGAFQDSTIHPDPRLFPVPKQLIVKGGAVFGGIEIKN